MKNVYKSCTKKKAKFCATFLSLFGFEFRLIYNYDLTPMVMIDGKLYYPLGRGYVDENHDFDGTIKSTVDSNEIPTENEQSNFGFG